MQAELSKKDQLIQTQYKTISLLKKVDEQEDFLQRAKVFISFMNCSENG